jgi:RHS repeat-associated protein
MQMPGRKFTQSNTKYRYGFNGKENDNDVKGDGNQQDYGMRIYDPRLVRFLSVDPITDDYPELTPYQFASNSPISGIDQDGLEWLHYSLAYEDGVPKLTLLRVEYKKESSNLLDFGGDITLSAGVTIEYNGEHFQFYNLNQKINNPIETPVELGGRAGDFSVATLVSFMQNPGSDEFESNEDAGRALRNDILIRGSIGMASELTGVALRLPQMGNKLQNRANEIHDELPEFGKNRSTTAVATAKTSTGKNVKLVASSNNGLTPDQRKVLKKNEIAIKNNDVGLKSTDKAHAEMKIYKYADKNNLKVKSIAAANKKTYICNSCAAESNKRNVKMKTPLKKEKAKS